MRRISLQFSGATLTIPGTLFGKPVRIAGVCIANVAAVCTLRVLDGAGDVAFVSASSGAIADVVFSNVSDVLGNIAPIPPDLGLNPQDSLTLTFAGPSTDRAVISFLEK